MSRRPEVSASPSPRRSAGFALILAIAVAGTVAGAVDDPVDQPRPTEDAEQLARQVEQQQEAIFRQAEELQRQAKELQRRQQQIEAAQKQVEALQREQDEKRRQAKKAKQIEQSLAVQKALSLKMAEAGAPGPALHGILAMLQREMADHNEHSAYPAAVRRLLDAKWLVRGETVDRDELAELTDSAPAEKTAGEASPLKSFRRATAEYRKLAGEPSPFDWTQSRDFWLDYAATALQALRSEQPAAIWKARIQDDPEHAELYRFSYVETLRQLGKRAGDVAFTLIDPLIDAKGVPRDERFRRLLIVTTALEETGDASQRYHKLLLASLKENRPGWPEFRAAQDVFRELPSGLSEAKRRDVVHVLLEQGMVDHAGFMTQIMNIPTEQSTRWFLSRPLSPKFQEKLTLEDALEYIVDRTYLPVWLEVPDELNEKRVNLNTEGLWIDVLERTAQQAGLAAAVLEDGIVWVGPAGREGQARQRLRAMRARTVDFPRLQERMTDDIEFTDNTAGEALEFLSDANNLRIVQPQLSDEPVNLVFEAVPVYFALGLVAEQAGLRWDVAEDTVIVAPKDEFEKWEQVIAAHRRKMIRIAPLQLEGNRVALALSEPTDIEFTDVPLQDAAEFLAEVHKIPIEIVTPAKRETELTQMLSGSPLAWALTLTLAEHDLTWGTDGRRVIIGSPEDVAKTISR